jgi:hypothetical protein
MPAAVTTAVVTVGVFQQMLSIADELHRFTTAHHTDLPCR